MIYAYDVYYLCIIDDYSRSTSVLKVARTEFSVIMLYFRDGRDSVSITIHLKMFVHLYIRTIKKKNFSRQNCNFFFLCFIRVQLLNLHY